MGKITGVFMALLLVLQTWACNSAEGDTFTIVTDDAATHFFTEGANGYYGIGTAAGLIALSMPGNAKAYNSSSQEISKDIVWSKSYKLTTDITFEQENLTSGALTDSNNAQNDWNANGVRTDDSAGFSPIGMYVDGTDENDIPFTGNLDGASHTISNLFINRSGKCTGLFGLTHNCSIKDISMEGISVTATDWHTGGLIGHATCSSAIVLDNIQVRGGIYGTIYVGGLFGEIEVKSLGGSLLISNSHFEGKATSIPATYPLGYAVIGGLAGSLSCLNSGESIVKNCSSNASVSGAVQCGGAFGAVGSGAGTLTVKSCKVSGNVTGTNKVGGFAGSFYSVSSGEVNFISNYSTCNVSGTQNVGGLFGINVPQQSGTISAYSSFSTGTVTASRSVGGLFGRLYTPDNTTLSYTSCYSTSKIISTDGGANSCGALIGEIYDSPNLAYTLHACYALNASLYNNSENHRIIGVSSSGQTLSNNYGLKDMAGNTWSSDPSGVDGNDTHSGVNDTPTLAITAAEKGMIALSNTLGFTNCWTAEYWGTSTENGIDFITRSVDKTDNPADGAYDHPVLAWELTPRINPSTTDSKLYYYIGKDNEPIMVSTLLNGKATFNSEFSTQGAGKYIVSAVPYSNTYGVWEKADGSVLAINDILEPTDQIYFHSSTNVSPATVTGLSMKALFVANGGRQYISEAAAPVSVKIQNSLNASLSSAAIDAAGGTVTVTLTNPDSETSFWKLVENSPVSGFSITSGTTLSSIAAGGSATATINVSTNNTTSPRSYSFSLQNEQGTIINNFTISQQAGTASDSNSTSINISSVGSSDPNSGNMTQVSKSNLSPVTISAGDIKAFTRTDNGVKNSSGNLINTGSILLSNSSVSGTAMRRPNTTTQDMERIIASLQNNGPLVNITTDSEYTDTITGQKTASGSIIIDPTAIATSSTNPISVALNDGTNITIISLPTSIKPNYGNAGIVTLKAGDKIAFQSKVTKSNSSSLTNQSATIELSMYLTTNNMGIVTTEHINGPVFLTTPYTTIHSLSDLNFVSGKFTITLHSENGSSAQLYEKGKQPVNDRSNGYYEVSGTTIIITVWHFSAISISGANNTSPEASSGGSCKLTEKGSLLPALLPLFATVLVLLVLSRKEKIGE